MWSWFFYVYELDTWSRDLNSDFTLKDCLFRDVNLAKNADPDKYIYTGYSIQYYFIIAILSDLHSEFSLPDISVGKNVIIFGIDIISSVHIDNKKKYILILGKGPTQEFDDTTVIFQVIFR